MVTLNRHLFFWRQNWQHYSDTKTKTCVISDWLTIAVSEEDLASELSSLMTIQPDTVSVKKDHNGNTYKFSVTFRSDRGMRWLWLVTLLWYPSYVKLKTKCVIFHLAVVKNLLTASSNRVLQFSRIVLENYTIVGLNIDHYSYKYWVYKMYLSFEEYRIHVVSVSTFSLIK